jgi:hypothetical protein
MVDLPDIKSNWFIKVLVIPLKRCSITLFHSFIVWFINLIPDSIALNILLILIDRYQCKLFLALPPLP